MSKINWHFKRRMIQDLCSGWSRLLKMIEREAVYIKDAMIGFIYMTSHKNNSLLKIRVNMGQCGGEIIMSSYNQQLNKYWLVYGNSTRLRWRNKEALFKKLVFKM